jgi:serine/threonine protein phosphatase 1
MAELTLPDANPQRLLAFGDIHGCREALRALLDRVAPTGHDQLVFLGDYIDRGPDSAGVVDDLLQLRGQFPHSVFLRGNHEEMLLDALAGRDPAPFLVNGGATTIASYQARGAWPPPAEHRDFFATLPALCQTGGFIFVHAGLRPGVALEEQQAADLLWIRADFLDNPACWGKIVVYGHTPREEPLFEAERIGLDTGCVYGGRLTCCEVNTRQLWQVSCNYSGLVAGG